MLIEFPSLRPRVTTALHHVLLTSVARWAEERLGQITPISIHRDPNDGTVTLQLMTGPSGQPRMTYTRYPDGSISMTKGGQPHQGIATGHEQEPVRELTVEISQDITRRLAAGTHRRTLAQALADPRDAETAQAHIMQCAASAATKAIAPSELLQTESPDMNSAIKLALTRNVARHITDRTLLNLITGAKNREVVTGHKHNLMNARKKELLELHQKEPELLSYHLTHTWNPELQGAPSTTSAELRNAVAAALGCEGPARRIPLDGFPEGLWSKLKPQDVSRICRFAGRLAPRDGEEERPKPATIRAVRELRKYIADPRSTEQAVGEGWLGYHHRENTERARYWLALLEIYDRDHDPAHAAADLAWMKRQAADTGRQRYTPSIPDPATTSWAKIRRN